MAIRKNDPYLDPEKRRAWRRKQKLKLEGKWPLPRTRKYKKKISLLLSYDDACDFVYKNKLKTCGDYRNYYAQISSKLLPINPKLYYKNNFIGWDHFLGNNISSINSIKSIVSLDDFKEINRISYQVLLGSVLGDGCVSVKNKKNGNCIFSESHGIDQRNYVFWKKNIFKPLKCNLYSGEYYTTITSRIFYFLKNIRKEVYANENSKNKIPKYFAENINLLGLLIFYLDDGTNGFNIYKNKETGKETLKIVPTISVSSFNDDDLKRFIKIINKRYNFDLTMLNYNKVIYFPKRTRDKLIPIWQEFFNMYNIPKCMKYKVFEEAAKNKKKNKVVRWSKKENKILKENNNFSLDNLSLLLPNRSKTSIKLKLLRMQGKI